MSKRAGVIRNLINSFFKPKQTKKLVGTDDRGNKYYEQLAGNCVDATKDTSESESESE